MTKQTTIEMVTMSAGALEKAVTALGDKGTWSPMDKGRTAVNQIAECALISQFTADVLNAQVMPEPDWDAFGKAQAALNTTDKAVSALKTMTADLVKAIEALPDSAAGTSVTLPWGTEMTLGSLPMLVYWNNTYHEGQINYISTLAD